MAINVGINGFGRIGRAIYRINNENNLFNIVAINDINKDIDNIAYTLKYDSIYGKFPDKIRTNAGDTIFIDDNPIKVYNYDKISDVPWNSNHDIDIVIDSSGIISNLKDSMKLKGQIKHVIVTNTPDSNFIDKYIIMGVNHHEINNKDFLISSSICDATAIAPVLQIIDNEFSIQRGFITTLHPWLGYQNLLDGPSQSYATKGEIHDYYALGRASTVSLIPKNTSAMSATTKVLDKFKNKFLSFSYRVPTMIVSSADITLTLEKSIKISDVKDLLYAYQKNQQHHIINNVNKGLISVDFTGSKYSANIDHRWLKQIDNQYLKLVLWYDNEWGYSSRIVDLVNYLQNK